MLHDVNYQKLCIKIVIFGFDNQLLYESIYFNTIVFNIGM